MYYKFLFYKLKNDKAVPTDVRGWYCNSENDAWLNAMAWLDRHEEYVDCELLHED